METETLELKFTENTANENSIPVIIVAGGMSSRMGEIDKKFLDLGGAPLIVRTLEKFENSNSISRIILVTRKSDINKIELLCDKYMLTKVSDIVEGGASRQESVLKGVECLTGDEKKVLIHDGARPFVSERVIAECVDKLKTNDAVLTALKINDTVKKADEKGFVEKTLDRTLLYSAQTPQGVDTEIYKKALKEIGDLSAFTDDASIMEYMGKKVLIVEGNPENIKITTQKDIVLANAIIKGEEECE